MLPHNKRANPTDASLPAWLAVCAAILAAANRVIDLNSLPPQAWVDEIWFAARARDLTQGAPLVAHYGIENTAGNAGLVYLTALVRLIGIDSIISARAVTAVAGIVAIPLAYACFKEIFRRGFAHRRLMAALVAVGMSVLATVVILSRVGMEPALLPPISLLVVWQMMVGLRRTDWARLVHLAIAGLMIGLAQYNGPHARFLIPLAGFILIEDWIAAVRREGWGALRRSGRDVLTFLVPAVVVTIPLALTFIAHPEYLTGRALSVLEVQDLPANALKVLGAFHFGGDLNVRHNSRNTPMLDIVLGVGMLIGLVVALLRLRSSTSRLLICWLVLMMIPSAITAEAPNFGRMIGAAVPAIALGVMGWQWLFTRPVLNQRGGTLARVATGVLLAGFCVAYNLLVVFEYWAKDKTLEGAFTARAVEVANDLVRRAESGENVYVDRRMELLDVAAFDYLFAGTPVHRVDFRDCWVRTPNMPVYYLVYDDPIYVPLRAGTIVDLDWQGRFVEGGIDAGSPTEIEPLIRFTDGIDVRLAYSGMLHSEVIMTMFMSATEPINRDWSAFFHVQPAGVDGQPPLAQTDIPLCGATYPTHLWQPGDEILINRAGIVLSDANLPRGSYDIVFGLYDPISGERAPMLIAERPLPDNRAILFSFTIP